MCLCLLDSSCTARDSSGALTECWCALQEAPADAPAAAPVAAPFGAPAEPSAETGGDGDGDDNELAKEEEARVRGPRRQPVRLASLLKVTLPSASAGGVQAARAA